jgi:iron complex transport system ATP-binding protein
MIRFQNLSAKQSGKLILQSITGHIPRGQLTGIIGPNGAGKSTLARALLGLLPSTGQIHINGKSLAAHSRADIAKSIAYLPQGQDLHWPLSVERLVSLGRLPHLGPLARLRPADEQAIDAAMEKTGTIPMRHRCAAELSGGERARVLLARALAAATPALIADEPLASLDPGYQLDVIGLLREQCISGTTIACVLHDLDMALRYCDNLILLVSGHILAQGPAARVLTPENLAAAFGVTAIIASDGQSLRITGRSPPP